MRRQSRRRGGRPSTKDVQRLEEDFLQQNVGRENFYFYEPWIGKTRESKEWERERERER